MKKCSLWRVELILEAQKELEARTGHFRTVYVRTFDCAIVRTDRNIFEQTAGQNVSNQEAA